MAIFRTVQSLIQNATIKRLQEFSRLSCSMHGKRHFSKYQRFTYHSKYYCSVSNSASSQSVNELLQDIESIQERQKCRSVVDSILLDPRTKMPYDEYIALCANNHLNEDEAKRLSEALHTTGLIWYFNRYFEEQKPLIIKTNEVCKAFLRSLDLDGTVRIEFVKDREEALKRYVLEIKPLVEQHEEIELKARKYVTTCWRVFFGYITAHCLLIPYLTFWKYSWDIMEPVTYMFNLWTLFMGTWFYMHANCEFSNEGISSSLLRMRKQQLYRKYNFDIERYTFLQEKIAEIEDDLLNPEWEMLKEVHPRLPDYVKHVHLTPSELLKRYQQQQMDM